jgi:hypothetical protein
MWCLKRLAFLIFLLPILSQVSGTLVIQYNGPKKPQFEKDARDAVKALKGKLQ